MERAADQSTRHRRLRGESDHLLEAVDEIRTLDARKREVDISTPAFHRLAKEIQDKSREVFRAAYREAKLDDEVETTDVSIEEVKGRPSAPGR